MTMDEFDNDRRIGRRTFLQVTAAGVSSQRSRWAPRRRPRRGRRHGPLGLAARHARSARRLSLLGGQEVRLFRRRRDRRWSRARRTAPRASSSSIRTRPTWAIPSPGVFSLGLAQGMKLVSVFEMGALDVFDFAFRKGEAPNDLKGLEGQDDRCSAAPAGSRSPIRCLPRSGVDITKVKYVEAGWPTWGTGGRAGQGRRRALPGKDCAPSGRARDSTSTI